MMKQRSRLCNARAKCRIIISAEWNQVTGNCTSKISVRTESDDEGHIANEWIIELMIQTVPDANP